VYEVTAYKNVCQFFGPPCICIGGSEKSKVGVAGDSGGGTISSSVAHDVARLDFEVG